MKHTGFNYKQIGVFIFLFLNCFLTTAPFLNASPVNNNQFNSSNHPGQNHTTTDSEESNRITKSLEERQDDTFSLRNKQKVVRFFNKAGRYHSSFTVDGKASDHVFNSSSFLLRPAYYTFLSLYKLF